MRKFLIIFDSIFAGLLFVILLLSSKFIVEIALDNSSEFIDYLSMYEHKNNIIFYSGNNIIYKNSYNSLKNTILCMDDDSVIYEVDSSIIMETKKGKENIYKYNPNYSYYFIEQSNLYYRYNEEFYQYNVLNKNCYIIEYDDYKKAKDSNCYSFEGTSEKFSSFFDDSNKLSISHNSTKTNKILKLKTIKECQFIKNINLRTHVTYFKYRVFNDEIYISMIINDSIGLILTYDYFNEELNYYDWFYSPQSISGFSFHIFENDYPPILQYVNF